MLATLSIAARAVVHLSALLLLLQESYAAPVSDRAIGGATPAEAAATAFLVKSTFNSTCVVTPQHPRPVVMLPGILLPYTQYMVRRLVDVGYCVYQLEYGIGFGGLLMGVGDMRHSAQEVESFVSRVLSTTGADQVDILGYSEGSLVMMYYLKQLDGYRFVHSAVGVAPVLHGTTLHGYTDLIRAIGLFCVACVQMIPNSTFLKDLYKDSRSVPDVSPSSSGPRYMMLMTNQDEVVTPYTSGVLDSEQAMNVVLEDICPTAVAGGVPPLQDIEKSPFLPALVLNHIRIMYSPVTFAIVDSFLDPTNARSSLDCSSS